MYKYPQKQLQKWFNIDKGRLKRTKNPKLRKSIKSLIRWERKHWKVK